MLRRPRNPLPPSLVNLSFFPFLPSFLCSLCCVAVCSDITTQHLHRSLVQLAKCRMRSHFPIFAQFPSYSPNLAPLWHVIHTRQRNCRGFNFMAPYYHTLSTTNNNAQRAGELASAKARNSFHIFSIQRSKITSSLPPSFQQHGGGCRGISSVDDATTHDFSRCGDATPIKRFRFGPRTETTFCSPPSLSSLPSHMCPWLGQRCHVLFIM